MNPDKTAIENLWEKHSFDYHEPGVRDPVCVMIKDDFLAAISEAEGERWIGVEERLPEDERDVLVYSPAAGFGILTGWLKGRRQWRVRFTYGRGSQDVTHWQPLPAPPKEKP